MWARRRIRKGKVEFAQSQDMQVTKEKLCVFCKNIDTFVLQRLRLVGIEKNLDKSTRCLYFTYDVHI